MTQRAKRIRLYTSSLQMLCVLVHLWELMVVMSSTFQQTLFGVDTLTYITH